MNILISFFNTILYQPLLNALIFLYIYLPGHDLGVAVIILTLIIRLILYPLSIKAIRSQKALSSLQPKMKEIQDKFKNDRTTQSRALMELYKKEKISPLSGCLPLLFQLPILIALYQVFLKGLTAESLKAALYDFVPNPGAINATFLGLVDLNQSNIFLALIAGGLQFYQSRLVTPKQNSKKGDFSQLFQSQMLYLFPVITVFIVWKLGSVLGLYWIVTTLFSIGEHYLLKIRSTKSETRNKFK